MIEAKYVSVPLKWTSTVSAQRWYKRGFQAGYNGSTDLEGFHRRGYTLRAFLAGLGDGETARSKFCP